MHRLAPKSRFTIWVNGVQDEAHPGEGLADEAVSTAVHADAPILVERAMWWPSGGSGWREAHASAGARESGTAWALAGGEQGGPRNVQTYVLLTNTSPFDGRVRMTLLPETGNPVVQDVDIPANSRTTVWMGGTSPTAQTPFGGFTERHPLRRARRERGGRDGHAADRRGARHVLGRAGRDVGGRDRSGGDAAAVGGAPVINIETTCELAKAHGVKMILASVVPVSDYGKDAAGAPIVRT